MNYELLAKIVGAHQKALVALLLEKGIITKEELRAKTIELTGLSEEDFDKATAELGEL